MESRWTDYGTWPLSDNYFVTACVVPLPVVVSVAVLVMTVLAVVVMARWRCSGGCRWGCDSAQAVGVIVSDIAFGGGVAGGLQDGDIEPSEFTP